MTAYTYRWRYRRWLPERYGRRCRVVVRGRRMNQIMVEFADGERFVTVEHAVEPVGDGYREPAEQGRLWG